MTMGGRRVSMITPWQTQEISEKLIFSRLN